MRIHCPECSYEGRQGLVVAISALFSRFYSQTNVTCPKCGFHRAFSIEDWLKVQR